MERELREVLGSARERAREADLLRLGLEEIEAVDPQPGEDESLAAEESRLGFAETLRTAAETAREALSLRAATTPDALGAVAAARARPRGRAASTTRRRQRWPTGSPRSATCSADVAADVASYCHGRRDRPGAAGRGVRATGAR